MPTKPGAGHHATATIRPIERMEVSLLAPLRPRFVGARALGAAHAASVMNAHAEGILEAREGGTSRTLARAWVTRTPRATIARAPTWEHVADGGLGRRHDPTGDIAWIFAFETLPDLDDASAAFLLARFVEFASRGDTLGVAVAVTNAASGLVHGAIGVTTDFPLPAHFPVDARDSVEGRRDAVLILRPCTRTRVEPTRCASLRVAAVQVATRARASRDLSFAHWEYLVARAAGGGASIALLPELLTLEWLVHESASVDTYTAIAAVDAHLGEYEQGFTRLAKKHGITIVAGTHVTLTERGRENVAFVFTQDGRVLRQPKLHPTPHEAETFGLVPGRELRVHELAGIPVAILTCYDAEFPEAARLARARGAELLLVPYNTETAAGHHRVRRCASARAVESHAYVLTAGAVGRFEHRFDAEEHYAASAAFGPSLGGFPDDGVLAELPPGEEDVLFVDLDFDRLRASLRDGEVRPWLDRRPTHEM